MDEGIIISYVGSAYDPKSAHRANTLLSGIQIRSNVAN
jgi:hypothetical protein